MSKVTQARSCSLTPGQCPDVISPCLWSQRMDGDPRRGLDGVTWRSHKSDKDGGGGAAKSPRTTDKSVPKVPLPIASSEDPSGAHPLMLRLLTLGMFFNNIFPTYPCILCKNLFFRDCRGVKVPGPTLREPRAHCEFLQHRNDAEGPPLKDVGKCGTSSRTAVKGEIMQYTCSSKLRYYYY